MKLEYESALSKLKRQEEWHRWFAWHPVTYYVSRDRTGWAWLRFVLRRRDSMFNEVWEYKL